jgi:hypothetical protein
MDNVNLLNLPPSEKLVAILDGELSQNEAGSFFQDLYNNQDLQDQFFDLIQIKNNFRGAGVMPPDFLKSNILKGIGLAAASTITYQTVATNNFVSWGSAFMQTLGSKISIAMISALMASLVTIGIMNYDSDNSKFTSKEKNSFANYQNNAKNKINNNPNNSNHINGLVTGSNLEVLNNKTSNTTNYKSSRIPITKSLSAKSTSNLFSNKITNTNVDKTKNLTINMDLVQNSKKSNENSNLNNINSDNKNINNLNDFTLKDEDLDYDKNSLVPGAVPESKYKVEIISKKSNSNNSINSNSNESKVEPSSEIENTTIKNDPNSDLDFYNTEMTKNMFLEQDSKMSFHFRNFSAKTVNDLDIPQLSNPIINNIGAGILFEMSEKWSLGLEIGQENFEQEFKAQNGTNQINLQQNHLAFWGGALVRYNFNNTKVKSEFNPYVNMLIGSTDIGPLVKPSIGITYNISNDFAVFGAGEYTAMYSKYNSVWYNTQKYGFTYGFILKF